MLFICNNGSITLFQEPPDGEHDCDGRQRHQQRAGDENGCDGHHQPGDKWNHHSLFPAVKQITAGDCAPNERCPKIMLIQQIHDV